MFKKLPKRKRERVKTVKVTTEIAEHRCSEQCFQNERKTFAQKLKKLSLGYIYQDTDGKFYQKWGDGEFLEVTGATFLTRAGGGLTLMFHPKHQLHIHSPGGRTIATTKTEREIRTSADFHAAEAAKKLKRKKLNLRQTQDFLRDKAAEIVPRAAKRRKPITGAGRGAPGQPRSILAKEIIHLVEEGKTETEILPLTIDFAKKHRVAIAGTYRKNIKKQIRFWLKKAGR